MGPGPMGPGPRSWVLGPGARHPEGRLFAYAFAENCTTAATGHFCATVEPQTGGAAGTLLRLEAYLDTVSGTRPSMGLVHPVGLVFTATQ